MIGRITMSRFSTYLSLVLTFCLITLPASAQQSPSPEKTEWVIQTDAPCLVMLAGQELARLEQGGVARVKLPVGEHAITAYGEHPDDQWMKTVQVEPGVKRVLVIGMDRLIAARESRERAAEEVARLSEEKTVLMNLARQQLLDPDYFALLPPGSYVRQDVDGVPHKVTLSTPIMMGKHEVTQAQWEAIMGVNPSEHAGGHKPVESVSWFDVQAFLFKLNAQAPEGIVYRLPTEAEWEYACRLGNQHDDTPLAHRAWFEDTAKGETHTVGLLRPNEQGMHDMLGNVWEWTADWYGRYPEKDVTDPKPGTGGRARVIRGGSWYSPAAISTCTYRGNLAPDFKAIILGFRLVRAARMP